MYIYSRNTYKYDKSYRDNICFFTNFYGKKGDDRKKTS